ncbi:concanavalin A-like lectin/glucanase domain-containing protein [Gilbertella persicaria]|uniref:concanavalin A-like lectin/glucanase domain-containing protein n=1 Tax=Gilbertella persicaria TaxID=101096 RepID=UPI00221E784A|nr:concanavalin A-like lectin/glucanase domain-containing protein [Gilbertella persicaria]KAI8052579.1 concanavalin A-like lectin/glucanase domain-containing protein [Gilbertella persicaria]
MLTLFAVILIIGMIVFFLIAVFLICFTRSSSESAISLGSYIEYEDWPVDPDDSIATLSEDARLSYERAKVFQDRHPPDSVPTDITPPQFISIQEKGVSAFEFEGEPDANVYVAGRTELQFMHGECCIQTNLPLPRHQEVYYWEAKMFEKPETTTVSVGVATKPYPTWRLPGWNRYSIGYFSDSGYKFFSSPFNGKPYGIPFHRGDIIGVGYRHRTGTVFFTRNGKRLEDAYTGLRWNLFPTIGANGPCQIHVNLGQSGFVFVEANVKKWGLAPSQGTLAPPPAYGLENDTILLATSGGQLSSSSSSSRHDSDSYSLQFRPSETLITIVDNEDYTASSIPNPPPYQHTIIQHSNEETLLD